MSAPNPAVRNWYVKRALESSSALLEVLPELTADEVLAAIDLESQTRRRRTVVDRLISRAVRLNEITYSTSLKEKYKWDDPHPQS